MANEFVQFLASLNIAENAQSLVNRAAQFLLNQFCFGRGEITVGVSLRDTKGTAKYQVLPLKGKSFAAGVAVTAGGGNVDAIVGNGSDSIEPKEMGAIPLAVATAAHRVASGKVKGPASEQLRKDVLAFWNQMMLENPAIRQDAKDLLVRVKSGKRDTSDSRPYKFTVLGVDGWTVTQKSVPTSMSAWEKIFTKEALASVIIAEESVKGFVESLVEDQKHAAKVQDVEAVKETKKANAGK